MKKSKDYSDLSEAEQREVRAMTDAVQSRTLRDIDPRQLDETNTPHRRWDPAWEDLYWPEYHEGIMDWVDQDAGGNKVLAFYLHLELNVEPTIELEEAFRGAMTSYLESDNPSKGKELEEVFFGPVVTGAGNFKKRFQRRQELALWFLYLEGKPKGISAENYLIQNYGDALADSDLSLGSIIKYYREYKNGK